MLAGWLERGIAPAEVAAGLEPPLSGWFDAYLAHHPDDLPDAAREIERVLSIPFRLDDAATPQTTFRLAAKYDLIAVEPGGRAVIVDWKTSKRRADVSTLRHRLQSIVYPYVLVEASAGLPWGPVRPEQVEMRYWFTAAPGQPVTLRFVGASRPVTGEVRLVEPQVDTSTRLGRVRIAILDPAQARAGMFADAEIIVDRRETLVLVLLAEMRKLAGHRFQLLGRGDVRHRIALVFHPVLPGVEGHGQIQDRFALLAGDDAAIGKAASVEIVGDHVAHRFLARSGAQEIGVERMGGAAAVGYRLFRGGQRLGERGPRRRRVQRSDGSPQDRAFARRAAVLDRERVGVERVPECEPAGRHVVGVERTRVVGFAVGGPVPEGLLETAQLDLGRGDRIVVPGGEGAVEDQGPGIDAEHLEHLFQRFYQVDPSPDAESHLGLGLAIVREIAEAHSGTVRVVSQPGVGSTFTVWLPLDPRQNTPPPSALHGH